MSSLDIIVKAYDIRGVYPDEIDEEIVEKIGWAFADFTAAGRMVVGHDMRLSSDSLVRAFIKGVTQRGDDVIDIGLASTDMLYFASGKYKSPGAMFTASHNPPEFNGIKMCLANAAPVGEGTGLQEIKALAEREVFSPVLSKGVVTRGDVIDAFAEHVRSFVDPNNFLPLRIVIDCGNGMGGLVVPKVFDSLPFEVTPLYFELDGSFPNHPADPLQPENLRDLRDTLQRVGADVGLAFDGDADRVFLIDDRARPLSGSTTTSLVAKGILAHNPREKVIHNLICSRSVPEVIRECGGEPIRSRVGHSLIKEQMAETGAIFAGEHSGHYYFRDNYRADSGLIAALLILEQICLSGQSLSELRVPVERYHASGEVNFRVNDQKAVLDKVAEHCSDGELDYLDGVTVSYPDWWFNLRPSNTEPVVRLNLEANSPVLLDEKLPEIMSLLQEC